MTYPLYSPISGHVILSIIPHIKIAAIAIDYTLIKTSTRTDRLLCIMILLYHMDTGMSRAEGGI